MATYDGGFFNFFSLISSIVGGNQIIDQHGQSKEGESSSTLMAKFTVNFNVEDKSHPGDWVKYRNFIEDLRKRLQGGRISHNRPVLDTRKNPRQWFHIVLQTNSRKITLRIWCDDLYLAGYQMGNSDQWLEFGSDTTNNPSPHLIPRSSFLGFDGSYVALQHGGGGKRENINLGQQQLTTAVNQLATSTSGQDRARSLIIVIQMICEAIRYRNISDHLATTFQAGSKPPQWMLDEENSWGWLSAGLLELDAKAEYSFRPSPDNSMGIVTAEQAADALGILHGSARFGRSASGRIVLIVDN